MGYKRKFKRDYIILEAKDMNFRSKERVLPKAFAKIEINDEKSVVALYVENLKNLKDGYDVIAIRSDYEKLNLGRINLNSQGKGEFVLDLNEENSDIKAVALTYDKYIPLIGFKGNKIENYEELIFEPEGYIDSNEYIYSEEYVDMDSYREVDEYDEIEYVDSDGEYEYEEIEYIYEDDLDDGLNNEEGSISEKQMDNQQYLEGYQYEEVEYVDYEDYLDEENYLNKEESEATKEYVKSQKNNLVNSKEYTKIQDRNSKKKNDTEKIVSKDKYQTKQQNKQRISRDNNQNKYEPSINESINNTINKEKKITGKLLMPRQIKKGLKYFKEVKPFAADYIPNTRWWKIDINQTTMCGYTMPYLGYMNTLNYTMYSDIAMNSYKYRHYLFGVQYDEYNKRKNYIYAIPGKKSEQPDKGTTGFTTYQACDNRNNSLGYWLCFIDSKARKIEK